MSDEFWAAIIGALVGAFAGGAVTFVLQLYSLRQARIQNESEKLQAQQSRAYALLFKVGAAYSEASNMLRLIEEQFAEGRTGQRPWQIVKPFGNFPDAIHFSVDEMTLFLELEAIELFNKAMMFDKRFNSSVDVAKVFSTLSRELSHKLAPQMDGPVARIALSPEQYSRLELPMAEVDSVIRDLKVCLSKDKLESSEILEEMNRLFKDKIQLKHALGEKN